jgi:hypothetical protein
MNNTVENFSGNRTRLVTFEGSNKDAFCRQINHFHMDFLTILEQTSCYQMFANLVDIFSTVTTMFA